MKYFFINLTLAVLLVLGTASCKKDGTVFTATSGTSGTLTASSSTLVLEKSNSEDTAITFNWSAADFGYNAAITQKLQVAVSGTNFANAASITLDVNSIRKAMTGVDFNALVLKAGATIGEATSLDVRIASAISDSVTPSYSNVVTLTVTPYALVSWIYVPGAYQNWDPSTADSLRSATGNGIYDGIISFPDSASEFKITPAKDWTTSYGDGGSGKLSTSGGNFKSPGSGSYEIVANMNTYTYTLTYFQWSVIGSATVGGWDTDTDMKYDFNDGDTTWSVTTKLTAGELKFRKNHAWDSNLGYSGTDGVLKSGGDNIQITSAGTYLIKIDLPNLKYTLTKQ